MTRYKKIQTRAIEFKNPYYSIGIQITKPTPSREKLIPKGVRSVELRDFRQDLKRKREIVNLERIRALKKGKATISKRFLKKLFSMKE